MGYIFDDSFGYPDIGLSQTQVGQFMRGTGAIGRGRYRAMNPSGPIKVSASYRWNGAQLLQFKSDWENPARLNWGASWFEIALPIWSPPYNTEALPTNLDLTVANGFNMAAGFDAANSVGSLSPATLYPRTIEKVGLTTGDTLIVTPVDNRRLAGSDELTLWFHEGGALNSPLRTLTWDGAVNNRYELTNVTGGLKTYLLGAVATTIPISIATPLQAVSSYPGTTFLNSDNGTTIGFDHDAGGTISRRDFFDFQINRLTLNVATQRIAFNLEGNRAIPGQDTINLLFPDLGGTFKYEFTWDYTNARYERGSSPGLASYFTNNIGTYIPFNFEYRTPAFGSYIAHFTAPYRQTNLGGNLWQVELPLEIDPTAQVSYGA